MFKLSLDLIAQLVYRFLIATEDEAKQTVIDQLGVHPVNHANFMRELFLFCEGQEWPKPPAFEGARNGSPVVRAYGIADYWKFTAHFGDELKLAHLPGVQESTRIEPESTNT